MALFLAGCTTNSRRHTANAPDWESEDIASARPLPAPPAPAPLPAPVPGRSSSHPFSGTWVALNRWCKANGLASPTKTALMPLPSYSLRSSNGVFTLQIHSQVAHWNGLELYLGFAPQVIDGQPYLHNLDLQKTVEPLICGDPTNFRRTNPIIVIDPGHGGENAGTKSVLGSRYEKEFTLDWARRLQSLLITNGWQVLLTRTNDSDLALSNRVAFAEEHKADLFLSLHFNSAGTNMQEAGLETYCLTPVGMPSTVTRGFRDDPGQVFPNNSFDRDNLQVASTIHWALLQINGKRDRGVRRARFPGVLRGQNRPAVLIEGGYLSNPHEARQIADPAYRQKLALSTAKALLALSRAKPEYSETASAP